MKRLPILLTLIAALACALLALVAPAGASPLDPEEVEMGLARNPSPQLLPAGKPGSWIVFPTSTSLANPHTQYQTPPDPCLVCTPWAWPTPGSTGPAPGQTGPQCVPNNDYMWHTVSCTCPATGGGTIGGTKRILYSCDSQGFWVYYSENMCVTGGSPTAC